MKDTLHLVNIYTHVFFGSAAMLIGLWPMITKKGQKTHRKTGKLYLLMVSGVLITAFLGALFFDFRPFLFLLTILVFYTSFVSYRTLKLKDKRPGKFDILVNIIGASAVVFYLFFFDIEAAAMNRPVVYATAGSLGFHVIYDFGKHFYSKNWLRNSWLNDHIFRVMSSYGGLICAFAGNVLDEAYQPWSQLLPSVITYTIMAYFMMKYRRFGVKVS